MAQPDSPGGRSAAAAPAGELRRLRELAEAELRQGRPRRAVQAYRKALALDPRDALSLAGMGIAFGHRDAAQSLKLLSAAYRIDPDAPRIANPLAAALLRNGRRAAAVRLVARRGSALSYAAASRVMRSYAEDPAARNQPAIRDGIQSLQPLLELLGRGGDAAELTLGIFANYLHPLVPWREQALDRGTDAQWRRWVEVSGLAGLQAVRDAGRGAILVVSHLAAERIATVLLARLGYKLNTLEYENRLAIHGIAGAARIKVWEMKQAEGFMLRLVYEARKALQRGEMFLVAGDGYHGGSEVPLEFLGRQRKFKAGFAEMAIAAGVPAFPVFCTVDLEGRIRLEIRAPLEDAQESADRPARVARLVGQYAAQLEDCWRKYPGNIAWYHLPRYFALPPAPGAGRPEPGAR